MGETSPEHSRVVQRVLSPARATTRARLIEAVTALAAEGGYEAVTVRAVAARAEVSAATAYQHVSSKDELLTEALRALGERSTAGVRERQPPGATPAARLDEVFARIIRAVRDRPLLYQGLCRGFLAHTAAVDSLDGGVAFGPEQTGWIHQALRGGDTAGLDEQTLNAAARVLSTTFLGAMVGVSAGRDADDVLAVLREATHRLVG